MQRRILASMPFFLGALLALGPSCFGQSFEYSFGLEKNQRIAYDMELDAVHPGVLEVEAEWPGMRILSLKLNPAVGTGGVQRSGHSPQRISVEIERASEASPSKWILSIRGVSARDASEGLLRVHLPIPAATVAEPTRADPAASGLPTSRFTLPVDAGTELQRFSASTDRFRALAQPARTPDACHWQAEFLGFLETRRTDWRRFGEDADDESLRSLSDLRQVIEEVESFRNSRDPLIVGPAPTDPVRRQAWRRVRGSRLRDLEGSLDALRTRLQRGHGRLLEDENWPARLVSCVTACQRHFDESVLYGAEEAINFDLAQAQWERILAASDALSALIQTRSR